MLGRGRGVRRIPVGNAATALKSTNESVVCNDGMKVLAKYSYNANKSSPLGFKELSMRQGEKLQFISKHNDQPHWWLVKNVDNQMGFAPESYLMKIETEVTSLPWLKLTEPEITKPQIDYVPTARKYVSAYSDKNEGSQPNKAPASSWECTICCKSFNGPHPYNTHLASKAHKEEVEIAKHYGRI